MAPKYDEGEDMVRQLQANQTGVDAKLQQAQIQLFKNTQLIHGGARAETPAEGEEGPDDSDAEGSGSEESESDSEAAESGSDEDEDGERPGGPGMKGMLQDKLEVQLIQFWFAWGLSGAHLWVCLGSFRGASVGFTWGLSGASVGMPGSYQGQHVVCMGAHLAKSSCQAFQQAGK